jgi:hypothetical protein
MKKRAVIGILLLVFAFIFSLNYVLASECNDHFDNNNDGYCDFAGPGGYCDDGSILGDANCVTPESSESSCIPSNEVCDGFDNNCDGQVDENLIETQDCGINVGECKYGSQTSICEFGEWGVWSSCSGSVDPVREICGDGKDNNCNGQIDENCGITGQVTSPVQTEEQETQIAQNQPAQAAPKQASIVETIKQKVQEKDIFTIFILAMIGGLIVMEIGLAFYKKVILGL